MNFQGNILSALGTLSQLAVFKNLTGNVKRNTENIQTAGERIGEANVRINKADERIDEAEDRVDKDMFTPAKFKNAPINELRNFVGTGRDLDVAKKQLREIRSEYANFINDPKYDGYTYKKKQAYYTKALEEARKKASSLRDQLLSSRAKIMEYEEGDKEDGTNK